MYQKILVPLDGSELAECVLSHVEAIAGGCRIKEVVLTRVVEPFNQPIASEYVFKEAEVARVNNELQAEAEEVPDPGQGQDQAERVHRGNSDPARESGR
jgi:nucleotide-binding universal stress UspA family protein